MFKKICALLTRKPKNPDFAVKMKLSELLTKIEKKQSVAKATTRKTTAKKVATKKTTTKKPATKKVVKKK